MDTAPSGDSQALVEQLLREAHVQRMRGQWAAAEAACRRALELAPDDPLGQELLGDLLLENEDVEGALEIYRRAFERQPGKAALEEKIARAVLRKAGAERERLEAQLMLANPRHGSHQRRHNATVATLLSMLCPGAGQIFAGQRQKGILLLVVGLGGVFLGGPELFKMLLGFAGALGRGDTVDDRLAALGILGALSWLYGLLDAAALGGKRGTGA